MIRGGKQLRQPNRPHRFKYMWTYYRGWKWLIFIGLLVALITSSYLVFIAKTTSVSTLQDALRSQTTLYAYDDTEVGSYSSQKGSYVELSEISPQMRQSVVSVEDKRFYEHNGFDTLGMGRAFVRLLINRNASGGGGSTITQQIVKNAFLSLDQTLQRKLKEFFLALEVEKHYSKDQILEMYLNHAYFGNGVWGVEDASMKYFGHSAATLDWNESAVLTGILKGPSIYNPIDDYDAAIERRNVVLGVLAKNETITPEDEAYLDQSGIYLADAYNSYQHHQFPQYFDAVIDEAIERADIPEQELLRNGYRIYTYLNPAYQQVIDQAYANTWVFPDDGTGEPLVQSASVVIDPKTGGVAALYGGRGDYVFRGFNRAIDMRRSPGSTIKPLAVYVPAIEAGYQVDTLVPDVVKGYGPDHYAPENYNHYTEPSGETPLYYALAQSKNTSAVYLMDKLGIGTSVNKLKQFGISIDPKDEALTLALGAMQKGISPLELANAYSAFANRGIRLESALIRRIEDTSGKVIYSNERPTKHMVMTSKVALEMTRMMLDTYGGYGTGYGAGPDYGQLAGKTGSTEVSEGNMATRDRWMVGYTPDFVIATWVGLDEEGDVSLDELMPSGLGSLFNVQTTGLMSYSNQTPFQVTAASQGGEIPEEVESSEGHWEDQADQFLSQMGEWFSENITKLMEQLQYASENITETIKSLLN